MFKSAVAIISSLFFVIGIFLLLAGPGQAIDLPADTMAKYNPESRLFATTELTPQVYLPIVFRDYGPRSSRLGYCATDGPITRYPDIRRLAAGWYMDFGTQKNPPRPLGMEYVQTVRLHQLTTCWPQRTRNRTACPYVTPYTYTLTSPSTREEIVSIAQANPGSLWLIGNEMDRYDWEGGGQDEMLPEVYAVAYHELYHLIKGADPTAKVAIGGVIQATPARLWYLTKVWDTYKSRYGTDMPVDVWNVHNFIFKEKCDDYGADVPPGYPSCYGTIYNDNDHDNFNIFKAQIRAFRQWMKDRGQQNKPLIVSEYGIVYYHVDRLNNWDAVRTFMLATFDYFMNEKDCSLGYPADECRLVQRWAWYSLDDSRGIYNEYSYLFNQTTLQITPLGEAYANYARNHLDTR